MLIHDGASYLAILQVAPTGAAVAPALTLSIFNLRRDDPVAVLVGEAGRRAYLIADR